MPKRNGTGIALLADPTRRRIIQLIAMHPRRPSALARDVGRSRPAISRQLRILREASLIRELPVPHDRRGALYGLNPLNLGRIVAWLAGTEIGLTEDMRLRPRQQSLPERLAADRWLDGEVSKSLSNGDWRREHERHEPAPGGPEPGDREPRVNEGGEPGRGEPEPPGKELGEAGSVEPGADHWTW